MLFSPATLYAGYAQLRERDRKTEDYSPELPQAPKPPREPSRNATIRARLRSMTEQEHEQVLSPLKGRHRRRMKREIEQIQHKRRLKLLRSGGLGL